MKTLTLILLSLTTLISLGQDVIDTISTSENTIRISKLTDNGYMYLYPNEYILFASKRYQSNDSIYKPFDSSLYYIKTYHKNLNYLMYECKYKGYCIQGEYTEYHPNGLVKRKGYYSEFSDKDSIQTLCNQEDGKWKIYDSTGKLVRNEYWNHGIFIREDPVRLYSNYWKAEIYINGKMQPPGTFRLNQVKLLKVNLYNKSNTQIDTNRVFCRIVIWGPSRGRIGKKINYSEIDSFDIHSFIKKYYQKGDSVEITLEDKITNVIVSYKFMIK